MTTQDAELYKQFRKLPLFPFYAITRQSQEELPRQREQFLKTRKAPIFSYPHADKMNIPAYLEALERFRVSIANAHASDAVKALYAAKCDEMRVRAHLAAAVQAGDGKGVTEQSLNLFGSPVESQESLAREFDVMLQNAHRFHIHARPVTSALFQRMARRVLDHYGMSEWRVKTHARSSITVMHGNATSTPSILVPEQLRITRARAARLLTHEIEVHALRTQNSRTSNLSLLQKGLDGYLTTEEGLAIYYQSKVRKRAARHASAFWDAWTCALSLTHPFPETFERIADAKTQLAERIGKKNARALGEDAAWRLCTRAYRGVRDTGEPGAAFARDHMYRSGLRLIEESVAVHGEDVLKKLFRGNIGLHHVHLVDELRLPEGRMPEMVSREAVK